MSALSIGADRVARPTGQPVRSESLDVDDPRAQVFRPIQGGHAFVDKYLDAFTEWANQIKQAGATHELSQNTRRVLEVTLRHCADYKTGICEPCLDTIMRLTRFARATVVRALAILKRHKWLSWVRRTERTGIPPGEGPQVRQVSNAYFLDLAALPRRVQMALKAKLRPKGVVLEIAREARMPIFRGRYSRRARGKRADLAAALAAAPLSRRAAILYPDDPEMQRDYNEMLFGSDDQGASSGTSLNPPPRIKYEVETIG